MVVRFEIHCLGKDGEIQVALREKLLLRKKILVELIFFPLTTKEKGKSRWPSMDKPYSKAGTILM